MTAPSRLDEREVPRHSAALYASDDQLQDRVLPYVVDGLAREETVLVVVSAEAERVLRSGLGSAADQVQWAAPGISYARLGVMFESFRSYFAARRAAAAPTRLVSEYDVDGGLARMAAYLRYEAMSTDIYAPTHPRHRGRFARYRHSARRQCRRASPDKARISLLKI